MNYTPTLQQAYIALWTKAAVRPERIAEVDRAVDNILLAPANLAQYAAVQRATGVPARVVGIIHVREASQNFRCHLHNGDPLSARTVHVPSGRPPPPDEPPFTWAESAIDALTMSDQALDTWRDWTGAGIAYVLERYNGWGYREHDINSPYLWGFTTAYDRGLFVADGRFDPSAVNANPGGMAMLRRMVDRNLITLPTAPAPAQPPSPRPVPDYPNDPVRRLQAMLIATGQDLGPTGADGDWETLSEAAWQAWRAAQGQ